MLWNGSEMRRRRDRGASRIKDPDPQVNTKGHEVASFRGPEGPLGGLLRIGKDRKGDFGGSEKFRVPFRQKSFINHHFSNFGDPGRS